MTKAVTTQAVRITLGPVASMATCTFPNARPAWWSSPTAAAAAVSAARNRAVAAALEHAGFGTLLLDLLTPEEESEDELTSAHRFNVPLLGRRVVGAVDWTQDRPICAASRSRRFGASTGAAAALIAAAARPALVAAGDLRGGRPDLAEDALPRVLSPTLLIVGGDDTPVIEMNRDAMRRMHAPVELEIVPAREPPVRGAGSPRSGGRIGGGVVPPPPVTRPTRLIT